MNTTFRFVAATFFCLLTAIISMNAQHITAAENPIFNGERKFTAGIALGTNISEVDGDNLSGFNKVGLNAGPVLNINFTDKVALGFEMLYSQKGSSSLGSGFSSLGGTYYGKYKMKLNYAELPLILYYNLQPKFQFGIGASYNVLISSKETYDDGMNPVVTYNSDLYPFNKSNIDALISGSVVVYNGLVLQARYECSLTPIRTVDHTPSLFSRGDQKNIFFALRLIYLF